MLFSNIFLAGNSNSDMFTIVLVSFFVLTAAVLLKYLKQPYIIAYMLTGILIGKQGLQIITDEYLIKILGEFGLILLLFFIGMEINVSNILKQWKTAVLGTIFQVIGSVFFVTLIGLYLNWSVNRIIILGFIISLSSSAVVIKLLQDNKESESPIGQSIISILLMQDIFIVLMLIITNYLGGQIPTVKEIGLQIIGGSFMIGLMIWVLKKKEFTIPIIKNLKNDHELQVFIALIFCFGFSALTSFFGLSAALGAFLAGMLVSAAKYTDWIHHSLHSFRVILVAIFFLSIGMLIDLSFLWTNWKTVGLLLISVYLANHFINSIVLYYFGRNRKNSIYGGALLGQVGELAFILASTALTTKVITDFEYQLTIITIALTLFISPIWILITKKLVNK